MVLLLICPKPGLMVSSVFFHNIVHLMPERYAPATISFVSNILETCIKPPVLKCGYVILTGSFL